MNKAQWLWYYNNIVEDQNEDFTSNRDLVEYQVSFFEPKIVKEIIEKRQEESKSFEDSIEDMFGRKPTNRIESKMKNMDDVKNILNMADKVNMMTRRSKDPTTYNFGYWLNVNLG